METAKSNLAQLDMKQNFSTQINRIEGLIRDFNGTTSRRVEIFEYQMNHNNGKIIEFDAIIKEVQKFVKETYETMTKHSVQIKSLQT